MKQWKKFLVACLMLLIFVGVTQMEVKAEQYTFYDRTYVGIWSPNSESPKELQYWGIYPIIKSSDKTTKVVKITQSKKILKNIKTEVRDEGSERNITLSFVPKKAGTTTLSITVNSNGKKKVHKLKIVILKYNNPVNTLKIGNKNYAGIFKKSEFRYVSKPKKDKNVKLQIKPKKGYTLDTIFYSYMKKDGTIGTQILKNGQKFKFRAKSIQLQIYFRKEVEGIEQESFSSIQLYFR